MSQGSITGVSRFVTTHTARPAAIALAVATAITSSVYADNTQKMVTALDLTSAASYSPAGLPDDTNDVVLDFSFPGTAATSTISGNTALTFGSLNDGNLFTQTINNGTAGTVATLTLGGPGSTGNAYAAANGGNANDLIFNAYVGLNINNGAGALNLVIGKAGNINNVTAAQTLAIGASINTNGNALTFTGAGTTNVSGVVSGSGPITIANTTGVVTFSGNNTFTGPLTVNAGSQFQFSGGATLAGPVVNSAGLGTSIVNNGTLFNGRSIANAVAQVISGTGNYVQLGTGPTTLNAANSYTGATILQGGTLRILSAANGGVASELGASSNAATNLQFTGGTLQFLGTAAASTDRLISFGNATANQAANIDASGTGPITFSNTGAIGFTAANVAKVVNLTGTNTGQNTFNPQITNNGTGVVSVTKNGTGVWVLGNAANTYTDNTTVNAGLLLLAPGALGGSGATLTIAAAGAAAPTGAIDQAFLGRIASASAGTIALVADSAADLDFSAAGANLTAALLGVYTGNTVNYAGTLTPNGTTYRLGGGGGTLNFNSNLTGANALTVNNATAPATSTVVLNGVNTYTGATTLNGGTLRIGNAAALPAAGSIVLNGGSLIPATPVDQALVGRIATASTGGNVSLIGNNATNLDFTNAGAAGLGSSGNFTYSGTITPSAANGYRLGGGGGTLTVTGSLTGANALTVDGGGLPGSVVTLAGTNSYTGATTVNGATLNLTNGNTLSPTAGLTLRTNGTIDLGGANQSITTLGITINRQNNATPPNGYVNADTAAGTYAARNGSLTLTAAADFSPIFASAAGTTNLIDLGGLTGFTYNQPANNFVAGGVAGINAVQNNVLRLAAANNITANTLLIGANSLVDTRPNSTLQLGATNNLNIVTRLQAGGFRIGTTTVQFAPGVTNGVVTFRGGTGGVSPVPIALIGGNNNGDGKTSVFDLSAGTTNAIITNLILALPNTASNPNNATLSISGTNSILNVGTFELAASGNAQAGGATINAVFNHNEGNVLANAVVFTSKNTTFFTASAGTPTFIPVATDNQVATYNLGTATTGATLSAATLSIGTTIDNAASRSTLVFNNGRIMNYDPARGQAGSGGAPGGPAVASDLTISGATGGGTAVDRLTLNISMTATGTHSFFAQAGRTITVAPTALLTGAGGPTVDGPGTALFNGANTYTGTTAVTAGILRATTPAYATVLANGTGGLDISGGRFVFDYTGNTSPLATVKSILTAGYQQPTKFAAGQIRSTGLAAGRTVGYGDTGNSTVTVRVTLPGDADLNGAVDFNDFALLQTSFGQSNVTFGQGDFDYSDSVDFNDFALLQTNFGQSLPGGRAVFTREQYAAVMSITDASQVPEPAALTAVAVGGLLLARRRRTAVAK